VNDSLLVTKLQIPQGRPEFLRRERLVQRLNRGLDRKLTLIAAPAGSGKTTMVSAWAREARVPVAWLSLGSGENDLGRFLTYLVAALRLVIEGLDASFGLLLRGGDPPVEEVLTEIINTVDSKKQPLVLVLDDYHLVETSDVHEALWFLVRHQPRQLNIVLLSRTLPPLPLARLRARGELCQIAPHELRFTLEETRALINDVLELGVDAHTTELLATRTEGWITGVQLAALSMRGREAVAEQVPGLTGSLKYTLDYLAEEVLDRQPAAVERFLMETSILECLTGSLCDAVTGGNEGKAVLEFLQANNVFVQVIDPQHQWYRYHSLFRDVLHRRLQNQDAGRVPELHRRASEWYNQRGQLAGAIRHALAAGDTDYAEHVVKGRIFPLVLQAQPATLVAELKQVGREVFDRHPWLGIAYGWALAYAGQYREAYRCLGHVGKVIRTGRTILVNERQQLAGYVSTIRSHVAAAQENSGCAVRFARQALEQLPADNLTMRSLATTVLAAGVLRQGHTARATELLQSAAELGRDGGDINARMIALCDLAGLQLGRLRLHQAAQICTEMLAYAARHKAEMGEDPPLAGYACSLYSVVLCEWNRLDEALQYAQRGLALSSRWGQTQVKCRGYVAVATAHAARGEYEEALEVIGSALERFAIEGTPPDRRCLYGIAAERSRIRLMAGDSPAGSWTHDLAAATEPPGHENRACHIARARMLIRGGEPDQAGGILDRVIEYLAPTTLDYDRLEALLLRALAHEAQGRRLDSLQAIERALELGYPEGVTRLFLDEGEPAAHLLYRAAENGIYPEYVGRLLVAFCEENPGVAVSPQGDLVEPLTRRELEVLGLLADGLTNREVADVLVIAVPTVKTHVRNIYRKLGVSKRLQAVHRARTLGLIDPLRSGE